MKVAVWDTYVKRKDGRTMHFDIIVPEELTDERVIFGCGHAYLAQKGETGQELSTAQCTFCHVETPREEWRRDIEANGYFIYEMENCA